jgi:hypothetical protein
MTYKVYGPVGSIQSPSYRYVIKDGADGKYDYSTGRKLLQWNNYTVEDYDVRSKASTTGAWVDVTNVASPLTEWTNNDELQLLGKLADAIRGHSFNLAVNIAQARQTTSLVVNTLRSLGRAALDVKRGNFLAAASRFKASPGKKRSFNSKDVSGRWLELQYGWLPAIGDSYQAVKAYESLTSLRRLRFTVTKTKNSVFDGSVSPSLYSGPGKLKLSKRLICEMTEDISSPRSLGLIDPYSVAWEVLPWSFVVDWFLPIGTYLDVLSIIPSLKGRFLTTLRGVAESHAVPLEDPPLPGNVNYYGAQQVVRYFYFARRPSSGIEVPFPTFEAIPDAMSPRRIWNAIALANQRFR